MNHIDGFHSHRQHKNLYVVLHAFCASPEDLLPIRRAIEHIDRNADIYAPKMPFAGKLGWLCVRDATEVVCDLIAAIDRIVEHRKSLPGASYETINFVGHSMGAVLARKIAIIAHGEPTHALEDENLRAPFEAKFEAYRANPRSWAPLISRIVLMAGMNRGWSPSSAMDWITATLWRGSIFVGETLFKGLPIIFDIRQGAVFSVETRLQWLALMHRNKKDRPDIMVVQLLGAIDDIVAPDDSVDYAVDSADERDHKAGVLDKSAYQSFFYLEVPNSGHKNIITLSIPDGPTKDWKEPSLEQRRKLSKTENQRLDGILRYIEFENALCLLPKDLLPCAVPRGAMSDSLPDKPNWDVTDVVFVIHGIRDMGFWTQKVARTIKEEATGRKKIVDGKTKDMDFRSVTTSYGYFAMAPFVLWWIRKGKAEWLMDQYVEARAHYPRADFSYVGHSNGTYLVARALHDYPAARFKRIVLAGSVVRCDYKWLGLINDEERIEEVLNYVATGDWVVALFTKGMKWVPLLDLGSGGHDGFGDASREGPVHQVSFIKGRHGAGHEERHWEDIARFIVCGDVPKRDARTQSRTLKALGHLSIFLLLAILFGVFWVGFWIGGPAICKIPYLDWFNACAPYAKADLSGTAGALRTLGTIMWFWFVYIVLSRV
jgi:pimeloyl-ACP methyl ester carboxylesterase